MAKVILLSQFPLPFSGIGSWTKLYENYFNQKGHLIEGIICPQPEIKFSDISYGIVHRNLWAKLTRRFWKKTYNEYFRPLEQMMQPNEKYIIQIVDNQGIVEHLHNFLLKKKLRGNCYIQFFYHGFGPVYNNYYSNYFFEAVNELVLLTHESYKFYKEYYAILPCRIAFLHNGIDTSKFHRIPNDAKQALKQKLGLTTPTVFLWCARDRPKKGLDFILEAWKTIYNGNANITLLVIGATRDNPVAGVQFLGLIPNEQLPPYYQASDVYLFPTLCHEGFGMSLIEALHCGNYCIASSLGGVPEVLQHGKLGKLIENPHYISEWVAAIEEYLSSPPAPVCIPADLYSTDSWNAGMNKIISDVADF